MALTENTTQEFVMGVEPRIDEYPVDAAVNCFEGGSLGRNAGNVRPLVAGDTFEGFCERGSDNSAGAAGDVTVPVRRQGQVLLTIVGLTAVTDRGATVHATDDGTYNLAGTSPIGKISRIEDLAALTAWVDFEGESLRSL